MKKLRIILLYSILFIVLFNTYNITSNNIVKTKYSEGNVTIVGTIIDIKKYDGYIKIILKSDEKFIVNYYKTIENLEIGNKVSIVGNLKLPDENRIFNLFNYKKYLLSKKINFILEATEINIIDSPSLKYKIKNYIIKRINSIKTSDYLNLFILGKNIIDDDVKESYRLNGISHLFAVSGMHITFLTSFLLLLLNKFKFNQKVNFVIISIFLIFYMFLTNYSASVLRASIFFILINIKRIFKINISVFNLFIILLITFLIYNPYYIYDTGFLFSFLISGALIYFNDILEKQKNYFKKLFLTSIISFFISIPVIIKNFHQINLLSPIINLFFVPLVSLIVFPMALLTFLLPSISPVFSFIIKILETCSLLISKLDLFIIILKDFDYKFLVIYTFLSIMIIKRERYFKLFIIIVILYIHSNINYFSNYLYISMIDIGQGDSILISLDHNKGNILIDTGGKINYGNDKNYSLIKSTIIPYLKSEGIKNIDYLILSHGDYDHMGEAVNLVNNFKVEKVIFNCGEFNELEQKLIKVLEKKKISYYRCIKELNIDNNKLYFLNNKDYGNENDNSNVIYTELNKYKFLFMGDAGVEVEEDLIEKYNLKDITVLKVGHHGSNTSSSEEFINNINPKYSLISVGKNNRYGHPNKGVIDNLEDSKIYRTDQDGSIMFRINKNKLKIETCVP